MPESERQNRSSSRPPGEPGDLGEQPKWAPEYIPSSAPRRGTDLEARMRLWRARARLTKCEQSWRIPPREPGSAAPDDAEVLSGRKHLRRTSLGTSRRG
jgi:hypothetical protein